MSSLFDFNFVFKCSQSATDMIKVNIKESLFNFEQFIATGDESYLEKERRRLRSEKTVSNPPLTIGNMAEKISGNLGRNFIFDICDEKSTNNTISFHN